MKKVKWTAFISFMLFLFLPGQLSAEEIGILPFRTIGVETEITEDFYDLLEDELDYFDHEVVMPYEIEDSIRDRVEYYNKDYAADYGRSLGIEKVIFGSIEEIDDEYVISVTVVESGTGEVLIIDEITLEDEDQLEAYVYSLVKAIEEEVFGNEVDYSPHYTKYNYIYIGRRCYPRRDIRRMPYGSFINISIPLFRVNLGRPYYRVVHRSRPHRRYFYHAPRRINPYYGRSKKWNHGYKRREKEEQHRGDNRTREVRKPKIKKAKIIYRD